MINARKGRDTARPPPPSDGLICTKSLRDPFKKLVYSDKCEHTVARARTLIVRALRNFPQRIRYCKCASLYRRNNVPSFFEMKFVIVQSTAYRYGRRGAKGEWKKRRKACVIFSSTINTTPIRHDEREWENFRVRTRVGSGIEMVNTINLFVRARGWRN